MLLIPWNDAAGDKISMTYTIRIAKKEAEFDSLEKTWGELLSSSAANNYFLSWEWLRQWWKVYAGPGDRLALMVVEREGDVAAIAPFYIRKRILGRVYPVRRMMFLGSQEEEAGDVGSDYLDIICRANEEEGAVQAIFQSIVDDNLCDEIYLSGVDTAARTFPHIREQAERHGFFAVIADEFESPYVKLPSSWEEYVNSLSSSMRYKIKNEQKKVHKNGTASLFRVERSEDLPMGYETLAMLHRKRWGTRGMEGVFEDRRFSRFHQEIMPTMLRNGHLDLTILKINSESKAALYNIVYNNKVYFYQSGIDTSDRKTAFGYVLHSHCIEAAIAKGMAEYDFLPKGRGDDYKDRFATGKRNVADLYLACHWAVKAVTAARESARAVYRRIKPHLPIVTGSGRLT
jgi:CelD/BcsL family acetyltransferase involved in cellulose biosynthesis